MAITIVLLLSPVYCLPFSINSHFNRLVEVSNLKIVCSVKKNKKKNNRDCLSLCLGETIKGLT